jgi:hypothetical protein|tara:strand:- start:1807 stop:2025 length:219 start_codon:yes stop_codon:yes gene_type:complete
MGKDKKTPITVNDKEYNLEDMTTEQQTIVNHISDLDRKINSAQFNMDQLRIGREAFANLLVAKVNEQEAANG